MDISDPDFLEKFKSQFSPEDQEIVIEACKAQEQFGARELLAAAVVWMVNHSYLKPFLEEVTEFLVTKQTKDRGYSEN